MRIQPLLGLKPSSDPQHLQAIYVVIHKYISLRSTTCKNSKHIHINYIHSYIISILYPYHIHITCHLQKKINSDSRDIFRAPRGSRRPLVGHPLRPEPGGAAQRASAPAARQRAGPGAPWMPWMPWAAETAVERYWAGKTIGE